MTDTASVADERVRARHGEACVMHRKSRMANQHGNGRNTALPQEGWRPQDENGMRHRRTGDRERDYGDEERFAARERERMGSQWDDRSARYDDREDRHRSTEWNGQGQSGYAAGRYEGDRSFSSRNEMYRGDEGHRDRGTDERFTGRGGHPYREDHNAQRPQRTQGYVGGHRGKGPASFTRSDDRIREIVCETLTDNDRVDATNIEVSVRDGEVTLSGTVDDREQKRTAQDVTENLAGVKDVLNQLRIRQHS